MDADSASITIPRRLVRQVIAAVVALVILAALALAVVGVARLIQPRDSLAAAINPAEYQAVFLSNGQVYFGHLSAQGGDFYYMRHVYYLTTQRVSGRTQRTLVKLVNDIQGPEDFLALNRADIQYIENLTPNGSASKLMNGSG